MCPHGSRMFQSILECFIFFHAPPLGHSPRPLPPRPFPNVSLWFHKVQEYSRFLAHTQMSSRSAVLTDWLRDSLTDFHRYLLRLSLSLSHLIWCPWDNLKSDSEWSDWPQETPRWHLGDPRWPGLNPGWPQVTPGWPRVTPGWPRTTPGWPRKTSGSESPLDPEFLGLPQSLGFCSNAPKLTQKFWVLVKFSSI